MNNTNIEYVDMTWNPVTGCLRGCDYCYARKLANGRVRRHYLGLGKATADIQYLAGDPNDPFSPRFWPDRMSGPSNYKKSKAIFVVDMGDLFGEGVPDEVIGDVIKVVFEQHQHDFLFLTKDPGCLCLYEFPPNAWVGATVTNEKQLIAAVNGLADCPSQHKFISFEPLLGYLPITWLEEIAGIVEWFIIGAQTKPEKQPETPWVLDIHAVADNHSIPVFHKDNLRVPERRIEWPTGYRKVARIAAEGI